MPGGQARPAGGAGAGLAGDQERAAGAIKFTGPEAQEEPRNLRRIKAEVGRRWSAVPLIDMLKEAILRTGCLKSITSVAGSRTLPEEVLAERLMLAIHAYGTNTRGLGAFHRGRLRVVGR